MLIALGIKASINSKNTAWFWNIYNLANNAECMQAFEDIHNMTIERFYNNYLKSNGMPEYRIVLLGVWSVDLKERLKFLTHQPNNTDEHRFVIRGSTHKRQRPDNFENSRFVVGSSIDSLT